MAVEIANAYVALTTQMPGVKQDIEKALGGADLDGQGRKMGSRLMSGLKTTALVGAAATGAAIVGTLGVSLTKGFNRLTGIENATAKMSGLGFSAEETQGLMDNALESVKGTAFGLESAAGVAAQLAATGIGPGEDMATILSTIAGSSAAAGSSMEEMGSIFSKAATQANGVQNDVISQLADRGIPIYQALAEELGVTAGEVFDLASAGEIGFDQFAKAAEAASGDVAAAMGETTTGSWQNLMASLGRSGAGLLGGVFEELAPTIKAITDAMGPMEDVAADVGETIGEFLKPGLEAFRDLLDSGFDFSQFGEFLTYLSPLGLAFEAIQPVLPEIFDMLGQVFDVLSDAASQILPVLMPVLMDLAVLFVELVAQILPPLLPLIVTLAEIVSDLLVAVMPLLEPLMDLAALLLPWLASSLVIVMPVIEGVITAIGGVLVPIIELLSDVLGNLIKFLVGVFTGDWEMAWEGIVGIFEGLWNGLLGIVEGVANFMIDIINGLLEGFNTAGSWLSDITGGLIGGFEVGLIDRVDLSGMEADWTGSTTSGSSSSAPVEGYTSPDATMGNGPQINVYGAPGMDEEVVGEVAGARLGRELMMAG